MATQILPLGKEELKQQFVDLRSRGHSYEKIAGRLHVAKGTLTTWSKELSSEIAEAKGLQREALLESLRLHKEGRLKQIAGVLRKLENELKKRDFSDLPTWRLAELVLKYNESLKDEITENHETEIEPDLNAEGVLNQMVRLFSDLRAGRITKEQAYKEGAVLSGILKAYETTVLEQKVDALQAAIGGRGK